MDLAVLVGSLKASSDPNVLVGFETSDDAGVYRLRDDLALVQSVDLITPVCDDPFIFGQVAAANSLSDVYAMGGHPITAMNICCFPPRGVPGEVYARILEGGASKAAEAGAAILGGHTVKDDELKYGLSVTGTVHPDKVLTNAAARAGDALILTKPIGTGIMMTGSRKGVLPPLAFEHVLGDMASLNARAGDLASAHGATACTDITGFGLAGHCLEMARASGVGVRIRSGELPVYPECLGLIGRGCKTGAIESNKALAGDSLRYAGDVGDAWQCLLFDPQTSGGLLISIAPARAEALLGDLLHAGQASSRIVGEVFESSRPVLEVVPA